MVLFWKSWKTPTVDKDPEVADQKTEAVTDDPSNKRDWCGLLSFATVVISLILALVLLAVVMTTEEPHYLVFSKSRFETMKQQKSESMEKSETVQKLIEQMEAIERKVMELGLEPGEHWDRWRPIPSEFVGFNEFLDKNGIGRVRYEPFLYGYYPKIDDITKEDLFPMIKVNLRKLVGCWYERNCPVEEKIEIIEGYMFVHLTMWKYEMTLVYKSILADL